MLKLLTAVALLVPAAAIAQDEKGETPQRIRSVTLQKGERCPPSTGDEVVVCSTLGDPYRIPAPLRRTGPIPARNNAWANRASVVADVSRAAGGVPNSCSAIGTAGQTGCAMAATREWAAQKREESQGTDGD